MIITAAAPDRSACTLSSTVSAALELEVHARQVVGSVRAAVAMASEADTVGEGSVSFGTFGSPHHWGLPELVRRFLAAYPRTRLRIVGRNSSSTADSVRSGDLDAAVVVLPIDDAGLEVRPLFVGEVSYASAESRRTRRPVSIDTLAGRPFILYESSAGVADPTRFQLAARAQAAGIQLRPRIEVESADIALEMAAEGLGDTYAPHALRGRLDPRLRTVSFDPPLVDTFALIQRAGSQLSRPVSVFVDQVVAHLTARVGDQPAFPVPN
jgi:DNA-binding transcriptional LysR family regulator